MAAEADAGGHDVRAPEESLEGECMGVGGGVLRDGGVGEGECIGRELCVEGQSGI